MMGVSNVWQNEDDVLTECIENVTSQRHDANGTVVFEAAVASGDAAMRRPPRIVLERERTGERFEVSLPAVLGRGVRATTKIRGNRAISRVHASLRNEGGSLYVTDLGSLNGTTVGGTRLAPNSRLPIHTGEAFMLASEVFRLHVVG